MRNPVLKVIVFYSFISIFFLIARFVYSFSLSYSFLVWNLFLAWIPYWISLKLLKQNSAKANIIINSFLLILWLLFYPNAPYILTDLFHLKPKQNVPLWFDLILILSFAWNGLFLGFKSLINIKEFLKRKFSEKLSNFAVVFALFLSSFGIYLGRYLRWNSWDILLNPFSLIEDIFQVIFHPFSNPRAVGFTLLFTILLTTFYYGLYVLTTIEKQAFQKPSKNQ